MERKEILKRRTQCFENINGLNRCKRQTERTDILAIDKNLKRKLQSKTIQLENDKKKELFKYNIYNTILKIEGER